jgi:hypothetical protein
MCNFDRGMFYLLVSQVHLYRVELALVLYTDFFGLVYSFQRHQPADVKLKGFCDQCEVT